MSNSLAGFWSYVHDDDRADGGRIINLAEDIAAQYEMLTGEKIDLFIDKDGISWGDRWRKKINDNLESAAFFIPVMIPRYFAKEECRREFYFFVKLARNRGLKELVLPLHYVSVPSLSDESAEDNLIRIARDIQWKDWRDLRFEERDSTAYRRAVFNLVERLVAANQKAEDFRIARLAESNLGASSDEGSDEALGTIDRMARMEEKLPKWKETIDRLTGETEVIGKMLERTTANLSRGGAQERFSYRLPIFRRLARELDEPTSQIATLAREYVSQLHDVDDGLRAIVEEIPAAVQDNPEVTEDVCQFFGQIRGLSQAVRVGIDGVQEWANSILPVERMSRDLRPRLRKLRQALTTLVDARDVTDSWLELMEASSVDCDEFTSGA